MTPEQYDLLINLLASVTLFEMMASIGLGVTFRDVLRVAGDWCLVGKAALASYVCVPAAAAGLLVLSRAEADVAAGFLVAAACPGAPYGPPLTGLAKGNTAVAVGLMVVLAASSALVAPLLLHFLLPLVLQFLPPLSSGAAAPGIDAGKIVRTLLLAQFLPLGIGQAVRRWRPALADRLKWPADRLSLALNLALLGLILGAQFDLLIAIPPGGYAGMLALVMAGMAAGALLGGGQRRALVMATAVRNVGVGLVIVTAAFAGTRAVAAATAFALFQTVVMALVALLWGRLAVGRREDAFQHAPGRVTGGAGADPTSGAVHVKEA